MFALCNFFYEIVWDLVVNDTHVVIYEAFSTEYKHYSIPLGVL